MVTQPFFKRQKRAIQSATGQLQLGREIYAGNETELRSAIGRVAAGEGYYSTVVLVAPITLTATIEIPLLARDLIIVGNGSSTPIFAADGSTFHAFTVTNTSNMSVTFDSVADSTDGVVLLSGDFVHLNASAQVDKLRIINCNIAAFGGFIDASDSGAAIAVTMVNGSYVASAQICTGNAQQQAFVGSSFVAGGTLALTVNDYGRMIGNVFNASGGTITMSGDLATMTGNTFPIGALDIDVTGTGSAITGNAFNGNNIDCTGSTDVVVSGNATPGTITAGTNTVINGDNS